MQYALKDFGSQAIAGHSVAMRLEQLILLPVLGMTHALLPLAAQNFGANKYDLVRQSFNLCLKVAIGSMVICYPIIWIFGESVISLFTKNEDVINIGVIYLRIDGLILPVYALIFSINSFFLSLKRPYGVFFVGLFRQGFGIAFFIWIFISIYDFGIFIEVAPDEEQKAMLEQNVQMALQKGDINLEDAIDIRELRNLKTANQLLKLKRKTKQDREDKMRMQEQQQQQEAAMQAQQMKAQADAQNIQMQSQAKMQVNDGLIQGQIAKLQREAELKEVLMDKEFSLQMQLRQMEVDALSTRETQREVAKSDRISQQNSEQSNLINQRKNNLPSFNFESNEDSLDGFDLAEFDPR